MPKTAIKRVGGKVKIAPWIKERLPPHNIFVDCFGGSFAVGFNMPKPDGSNYRIVYNDIDRDIWNFFRVLRENPKELIRLIDLTPYSRHDFDDAVSFIKTTSIDDKMANPLEWARNYVIYNRQSIFGKETGNWCISREGENISMTWNDLPPLLNHMAAHLKSTFVECLDYRELIPKWDTESTLVYIDPPYEGVEKDFYSANKKEGFDHSEIPKVLAGIKGSWAVSYYDSPYIRDLYRGHKFYELSVKKHMQTTSKKSSAVEVLIVHQNEWSKESHGDCFDDN